MNMLKRTKKGHKMEDTWLGPYEVAEISDLGACILKCLKTEANLKRKTNISQLKLYAAEATEHKKTEEESPHCAENKREEGPHCENKKTEEESPHCAENKTEEENPTQKKGNEHDDTENCDQNKLYKSEEVINEDVLLKPKV